MLGWWTDVAREASPRKATNARSFRSLIANGMILFIASEVMFLRRRGFWATLAQALVPAGLHQITRELIVRRSVPRATASRLDSLALPLLNHAICSRSESTGDLGASCAAENDRQGSKWGLILTIVLV